jgi:hypothetical protein
VATKTISDEDIPSAVSLGYATGSARMVEDPTGSNYDEVKKLEDRWTKLTKNSPAYKTCVIILSEKKLHGLSPRANYTDRATAACRRSDCQLLRIEGATWSA